MKKYPPQKGEYFKERRLCMDKILLNVKEFCQYLNIGETKAREYLTKPDSTYALRIGNRLYAFKPQLDKYIEQCIKNKVDF